MKALRGGLRANTNVRLGGLWGFSPPAAMPQKRLQNQQQQQQEQQRQRTGQRQSPTCVPAAGRPMGIASGDSTINSVRCSSSATTNSNNESSSSNGNSSSSTSHSLAGGDLLVEKRRGPLGGPPVYTVTLNRPRRLNALSLPLLQQLQQLLLSIEQKEAKNALIILRGEGKQAFCAGGDVRAIAASSSESAISFFSLEYSFDLYLAQQQGPPVVALWDGIVFGGGVGLTVHGGLRVCTENTLFSMPEVHIGLFPDAGMTQAFADVRPRGLGLFLALTGERLRAADLIQTGFATHYLPSAHLPEAIARLQEGPPPRADPKSWASRVLEEVRKGAPTGAPATPPEQERLLQPQFLQFLERYFANAESLQSLVTALEENSNCCSWCRKTLSEMQRACPLSLAVSFKAIRDRENATAAATAARTTTSARGVLEGTPVPGQQKQQEHQQQRLQLLREALQVELVLMGNMAAVSCANFREGVRALLIDKDKKPQWQPNSLKGVSEDAVSQLFQWKAPLPLARL